MKVYRHGIVGMGNICKDHYLELENLKGIELVAICDIDKEAVRIKGDMLGIDQKMRFTSYDDFLACPDIDSISICTPNFLHCEMMEKAIAANKPFALEKPISVNMEESIKMREFEKKTKLPHMVCFSYRFMPAARYAKYIVENGYLGKINHVFGQYIQGWGNDDNRPLAWRFQKDLAGSGAMGDIGSHIIDLTRFVVGEFEEVTATAGLIKPQRRKIENPQTYADVTIEDDYAQFLALLDNGITANYAVSRFAYGQRNLQRLEIYGDKGGLIYTEDLIDGKLQSNLQTCIGDIAFKSNAFVDTPIPMDLRCSQMEAFLGVLNGKTDTGAAMVEDGYRCDCVVEAVLKSAKTRQWEKVSLS